MVSVERALYEKKGSPHFFVKLRITNLASEAIFVDLSDYWKVIYPNQWGVLLTDHRQVINERRLEFAALDGKRRFEVLDAFRKKQLTIIPTGTSHDYFREFNASERNDVEKQMNNTKDAKWVFVSMDGQLVLTDGHTVEQISCSWEDERVSTDVILPFPVTWKTIPETAIVIEEK